MNWKIRVIVNNHTADKRYIAEHGLSLLLHAEGLSEDGGNKDFTLLVDTALRGTTLLGNLAAMGIGVDDIDALFLSHGHYDHTGGLEELLRSRSLPLTVFAHPHAFEAKMSMGKAPRDTSCPITPDEIRALGGRIHPVREAFQLLPELLILGEIPRRHTQEEEARNGMFTTIDGKYGPDLLLDDTSLAIKLEGGGLFLVCGCCHSGLINTMEHALELSGEKRIKGVIGGLHTIHASEKRMRFTVEKLKEYAPKAIYPLHCAGQKETAMLYRELGEMVHIVSTGAVIEL
jgi:7,8-dihydropterin-6-yl-methyl-4-(beta-D-ribofuranosyl)aminobenzene 5'-phosphate synthase